MATMAATGTSGTEVPVAEGAPLQGGFNKSGSFSGGFPVANIGGGVGNGSSIGGFNKGGG
jgi:hypothetical protein